MNDVRAGTNAGWCLYLLVSSFFSPNERVICFSHRRQGGTNFNTQGPHLYHQSGDRETPYLCLN